MNINNLFADIHAGARLDTEQLDVLHEGENWRLERIVSTGHVTAPGTWYDQPGDEWVLLLRGSAELRFLDPDQTLNLGPGDHLLIPAHRKHRVEVTDAHEASVWLALHISSHRA